MDKPEKTSGKAVPQQNQSPDPKIQFNLQANAYADRSLVSSEILDAISKDAKLKEHYLQWVDVASQNTKIATETQAKQVEYVHEANQMNYDLQKQNQKIAKTDVWLRSFASILPSCFSFLMK